jgi:hypothetical protein
MNPAQLERIVSSAEEASALVIAQPKDVLARQRLFDALTLVVDPAFVGEGPEFDRVADLLIEARVWADIVRTRISVLPKHTNRVLSVLAIQHPARELLPILTDLRRECALGQAKDMSA